MIGTKEAADAAIERMNAEAEAMEIAARDYIETEMQCIAFEDIRTVMDDATLHVDRLESLLEAFYKERFHDRFPHYSALRAAKRAQHDY